MQITTVVASIILLIGGIVGFIYFGKTVPIDLENGLEWELGDQIIHYDMDQTTCEANNFTWVDDYMITYDDMEQDECEENGYTW